MSITPSKYFITIAAETAISIALSEYIYKYIQSRRSHSRKSAFRPNENPALDRNIFPDRVLGCFFHGNELGCTQIVSHVIAPPPPPLELEVSAHDEFHKLAFSLRFCFCFCFLLIGSD